MQETIPTRDEVKARLEQRSASISERIEAIETALPVRPRTLRRIREKKSLIGFTALAASGAVFGLLVVRSFRKGGSGYREGLEHLSETLTKEIRKNIRRGMDTDDAVRTALKKRPPVVRLGGGDEAGGMIASLAMQIARQIIAALGPVLSERLSARFRQDEDAE